MSNYERNKGKLIPCRKSLDEIFTELGGVDSSVSKYYTKFEWVRDRCGKKYEIINDELYEVEWEVDGETDATEFADIEVREDGSITFHTYHYNGGGYWTEVVENALKRKGGNNGSC